MAMRPLSESEWNEHATVDDRNEIPHRAVVTSEVVVERYGHGKDLWRAQEAGDETPPKVHPSTATEPLPRAISQGSQPCSSNQPASPFPVPDNEEKRLAALHRCHILDTLPEEDYDALVFLAAQICDAPVALISLADAERQWFKARFGVNATEIPRAGAFCAHALLKPHEVLVVPDAREDARFANTPLVAGEMGVRFYAGAPIVVTPPSMIDGSNERVKENYALGTVCVVDTKPREFTPNQLRALQVLSQQVGNLLDLRLRRLL